MVDSVISCNSQPICGRDPSCCEGLVRCLWSRRVEAGEPLYEMGDRSDGIWQVIDGIVGLRLYGEDGGARLLRLVRKGDIFGYRSFLAKEEHFSSAYAVTRGTIRHVPGWAIRRVAGENPDVWFDLQRCLGTALRDANQRLLDAGRMNLAQRFIRFLAEMAGEQEGKLAGEWRRVDLPINYQDIASLLGSSPETLSRVIRKLESQGVVRAHRRGMIEVAPRALTEAASRYLGQEA